MFHSSKRVAFRRFWIRIRFRLTKRWKKLKTVGLAVWVSWFMVEGARKKCADEYYKANPIRWKLFLHIYTFTVQGDTQKDFKHKRTLIVNFWKQGNADRNRFVFFTLRLFTERKQMFSPFPLLMRLFWLLVGACALFLLHMRWSLMLSFGFHRRKFFIYKRFFKW